MTTEPFNQAPPRPRDLYSYLGIRFANTVATQIQSVAVGWQVYDITNDPFALGYVGLLQFVPMLLLVLPAGDLADRVDRRFVLLATHLVEAVAAALLLFLSLTGSRDIWMYYAVITLFGVARGLYMPAQSSLLAFLVEKDQLPRAIALSSSVFTTATIGGPAIGGILYMLGPAPNYAVCFVLFLLCGWGTYRLRIRRNQAIGQATGTTYSRVVEGFTFIRARPILGGAITLDLFAVLFGGAVALLPIYARDILHVGPTGLGLLRTAPAVGAALVAFWLARWPLQRHTGNYMFVSVALFGVATIVFGLSESFLLSLFALAITGGADMISVYVRSSFTNLTTPDSMRGRVGAVNALFIGASNELGEFESGVTAGYFGTVRAVVLGGVGTLVVTGLWMKLFPELRAVDRFSELSARELSEKEKQLAK